MSAAPATQSTCPDDLPDLAERYVQDYFAFYPTVASSLGLHAYDGQITDMSSAAVARRVASLRAYRHALARIDTAALGRLAAFDYDLLCWQVEAELWSLTEEQEHIYNPIVHAYNAMVDMYIKRDYAPLPERAAALVQHLNQVPEALHIARQSLSHRLPRVLVEEAMTIFAGLHSFLSTDLPAALHALEDRPLQRRFAAAHQRAAAALQEFQLFLRNDLLPTAHSSFALGAQRFANLLQYNELIDLPLEKLLALGEQDLARNQAHLAAVAARIDPTRSVQEHMHLLGRNHPPAQHLIAETRALLDNLRGFLQERDLVTLPAAEHCLVEPTPPFARWAFALMDTAGPFEQAACESFYYITLPEADWTPAQVEGWLSKFDFATLTDVSIHEAYPGHYIHFTRVRQAPTKLAKVFATYSHYESWAHYAEQMMLDQGYGDDDPTLRMAQLAEALVRNCRFICAIKMHAGEMRIEEATRFFMQHAYMDPLTASKEAWRGTHDPGYINYTLGKLLLLKLLEEYKAAHGHTFSLKRFHDEYISYGSPPIPLLRKLLLPGSGGALL
jgi:uncharacterized protein (DUF885 family)